MSVHVSSQVRKELHALFFGSSSSGEAQGELPESLVVWLSQHYASTGDLRASLVALEHSILSNISRQLELNRAQTLSEAESKATSVVGTMTGTVPSVASAECLSEEVVEINLYCPTIKMSSCRIYIFLIIVIFKVSINK